jgi:hypothetical protein
MIGNVRYDWMDLVIMYHNARMMLNAHSRLFSLATEHKILPESVCMILHCDIGRTCIGGYRSGCKGNAATYVHGCSDALQPDMKVQKSHLPSNWQPSILYRSFDCFLTCPMCLLLGIIVEPQRSQHQILVSLSILPVHRSLSIS